MLRKSGSSLIIVILVAVIVIVVVFVTTSRLVSQTNARDVKRKADIDLIAKALESRFEQSINEYPPLSDDMFQNGIPKDPINQDTFQYQYFINGITSLSPFTQFFNNYVICARLENKNGNAFDTNGFPATESTASFYCRSSHH